jgi:effector-binding domain-containing protein
MLKIGDFSKLSQISVKALRLYDQLGLLKPAQLDHFTGYRYYSARQLPRLNRILALKDLGFSLDQIAQLLDDPIAPAPMRQLLQLKQTELQQLIEVEQARLARVALRLNQIDQENSMPEYEIVIKSIAPMTVASVRDIVPNYPAIGQLCGEVDEFLAQHQIKPKNYFAAIWHDPGYKESDVDGESVVAIDPPSQSLTGTDRVKIYELPGYPQAACVIHHGSYQNLTSAYTVLLNWIDQTGAQIIGPNREVYIQGGPEQDDESYVTEIQFPIARAGELKVEI